MQKRTESQAKYDAENTQRVNLKLNTKTDADVLDWLNKQESKQGAIKALIRKASTAAEIQEQERPHNYYCTYMLNDSEERELARYAELTKQSTQEALQEIMTAFIEPTIEDRLPFLKLANSRQDKWTGSDIPYRTTFHLTNEQEKKLEYFSNGESIPTWRAFKALMEYHNFDDVKVCTNYAGIVTATKVNPIR